MSISIQRFQVKQDSLYSAEEPSKETSSVDASGLTTGLAASDQASNLMKNGIKDSVKILLKQFSEDLKTDSQIDSMKDSRASAVDNLSEYQKQRDKVADRLAQVREDYQVSDDSQEEADLELLQKQKEHPEALTQEDQDRLADMGEMTDYQKEVLDLDDALDYWDKMAQNSQNVIENIGKSIDSVKLERLKSNPMTEAKKEADEVRQAAVKSSSSVLMEEAMDNIKDTFNQKDDVSNHDDQTTDTKDTNASEVKKEEEKGSNDNNTEAADSSESFSVEDAANIANIQEKQQVLLKKVQNMIDTQLLTENDVKGVEVDTLL